MLKGMHLQSVDAATFEGSKEASSRRNVSRRSQRGGGGKPAPPDYNDDTKEKVKEIWFDANKKNPFQGAQMREWCIYALGCYETWRMEQIATAQSENRNIPPLLLETNYSLVSEWAKHMKESSSEVQRVGAFNAESSQLSSQLKSFTPTTSPAKDLNLGETTAAADLAVKVVTATDASPAEFPSPTSTKVQQDMVAMVAKKPPPSKKRKARPPPVSRRREGA